MLAAAQATATVAHADTPSQVAWKGDLSDTHTSNIISNPDGGVTVSNCSATLKPTVQVKSFGPDGSVTRTLPASTLANVCLDQAAVGADGTLYTVVSNGQSGSNLDVKLAAYKGNQQLWAIDPPSNCTGYKDISSVTVGSDSKVYFLVTVGDSCRQQPQLVGLNPKLRPGSTAPQITTNRLLPGSYPGGLSGLMAAYKDGLMLHYDNNIRYFDYAGNPGAVYPASAAPGAYRNGTSATLSGRVFVPVKAGDSAASGCASTVRSMVVASIDSYEPKGAKWSKPLDACSSVVSVNPAPDGGAVLVARVAKSGGPEDVHIIRLAADGSQMWDKTLPAGDSNGRAFYTAGTDANVDVHGHVIVKRRYKLVDTTSTYEHLQLQVRSVATGEAEANFYTDSIDLKASFNDSAVPMALAQDRAYLALTKCDPYCHSNPELYVIKMAGVGMDYPRGAIITGLTPTPTPAPKVLKYVALGDSFSAGEGVPPYFPGTDVPATRDHYNLCHRSKLAYSRLLANEPTIELIGSFACSGATTANVWRRWQYLDTQPPQATLLSKTADIVTLTIGGNDVGFSDFAKACVNPKTTCAGTEHQQVVARISGYLPGNLAHAYDAIRGKMATHTRILVIGYPLMIPAPSEKVVPLSCAYLSKAEKEAARDVISRLNSAIRKAVLAANEKSGRNGPRFEYIDPVKSDSPFKGHELCKANSYFNNLTPSGPVEAAGAATFHPNKYGQDAYYRLVKSYLGRS
ncbi:SGNH/GDSL hydrolase family protein [Streptomyces olivoreticuli]